MLNFFPKQDTSYYDRQCWRPKVLYQKASFTFLETVPWKGIVTLRNFKQLILFTCDCLCTLCPVMSASHKTDSKVNQNKWCIGSSNVMWGPFSVGFQNFQLQGTENWFIRMGQMVYESANYNYHLNARHSEVGNLKLDADGRSPFSVLVFHAWKTKVSSHQVLFTSLWNKQKNLINGDSKVTDQSEPNNAPPHPPNQPTTPLPCLLNQVFVPLPSWALLAPKWQNNT